MGSASLAVLERGRMSGAIAFGDKEVSRRRREARSSVLGSREYPWKTRVLLPTVLVALVLALPPVATGQDVVWTRQFGTGGSVIVFGISVDTSGVYVGGHVFGALSGYTPLGNADAFVRKYDDAGTEVWTRQFGTSGSDIVFGVSVDASGVYVAGEVGHGSGEALPGQTSSGGADAFVRKYDTAGTEVWTRQFGTSATDHAAGGVSVGASGVYVSGFSSGTLPGQTASGGADTFVRKYDTAGTEMWTRQFGASGEDSSQATSSDASGVYVSGYVHGALPGQTSSGGADAYVRKYDTAGTEVWTRQFGSAGSDQATGIAIGASEAYVVGSVAGALPGQTYSGTDDAFVRKYDATGGEVWTRQFGTAAVDTAYATSVDGAGVYLSGSTKGTLPGQTSSGDADAFVRKYDAAGGELWTHQFGTAVADEATGISVAASGVYTAGRTSGALPTLATSGGVDAFVRKYDDTPITILGFYQPVDMGDVVNTVKGGATVPLKFEVFDAGTERTDLAVVQSLTLTQVVCVSGLPSDSIEITATGGTELRYDTAAGQFIYNWKTPKLGGTCWDVTLTVVEGASITAHFRLK